MMERMIGKIPRRNVLKLLGAAGADWRWRVGQIGVGLLRKDRQARSRSRVLQGRERTRIGIRSGHMLRSRRSGR